MPKSIFAALSVLFLLVTPAAAADPWSTYTNQEFGFRVELQGAPTVSTAPLPDSDAEIQTFIVEYPDTASVVSTFVLPPGITFDLDKAVEGAVEANKGQIVSRETITVSGRPARLVKYVGGSGDAGFTSWYLVLATDTTVYSTIVVKVGAPDDASALRVIRSFRLTD